MKLAKETLNLISGDEAISVDDIDEAQNLLIKKGAIFAIQVWITFL